MMVPADLRPASTEPDATALAHASTLLDSARLEMDGTMGVVRTRSDTYLDWYSPPFDTTWRMHDAWPEPIDDEDVNTSRSNLTLARAVVDIWAAIEAASAVMIRAEPEAVAPLLPSLDQAQAMRQRMEHDFVRTVESIKADIRSRRMRTFMRRDKFDAKQFYATRKKNLHGFSWMKVLPDFTRRGPASWVCRDPTTVYPWWSTSTPGDIDVLVSATQVGARWANQRFGLGLEFKADGRTVMFKDGLPQGFAYGQDAADYRKRVNMSFSSDRTMVWVEELWWIDRQWDPQRRDKPPKTIVHCAVRVAGRMQKVYHYPDWKYIPYVYWQNSDEREDFGWSDVANVMDLNDELNRRFSQQGDTIGMYSSPRFMHLNGIPGREVSMPGPFQITSLPDAERIEQILTRIDTYPTDRHFDMAMDLLHRTTGLPPIVWGLINNAQTSGRALSASWKATETRLASRLIDNQQSVSRYVDISEDYASVYDWYGSRQVWVDNEGDRFDDWRYTFNQMEPRDFMEVTQDAITKRDAGIITTIMAMRATGDENAEDTMQEVLAEKQNIFLRPTDVQAFLLAQRAQLDNMAFAQQLAQQGATPPGPTNTATVAQMVGQASAGQQASLAAGAPSGAEEGTLPPTQAGAIGNAGTTAGPNATTASTMMQDGEVTGRYISQGPVA